MKQNQLLLSTLLLTGAAYAEVKEGDFQVVCLPEVATPTAVRYGWSKVPNAALLNKDGLPASPFRSDVE